MLIRHLAYFVTLAREKHFARAAELCNVAQPTFSAAIHKLEEDLGFQLVIRKQPLCGVDLRRRNGPVLGTTDPQRLR